MNHNYNYEHRDTYRYTERKGKTKQYFRVFYGLGEINQT